MTVTINAAGMHYKPLNELVKSHCQGEDLLLENVNGQRYIGGGLQSLNCIEIDGVPGNDLAVFMDGPKITVKGNIQDAAANTMNSGLIVVHGRAGDTLGYGMRGGEVFIRDDVGYRSGIHMKEYGSQIPALVIGGVAGDFLGEYMAGGIIIILNLQGSKQPVGSYCASGMHGGKIFIKADQILHLPSSVAVIEADEKDKVILAHYIAAYEGYFGLKKRPEPQDFLKLSPASSRPYHNLYVGI